MSSPDRAPDSFLSQSGVMETHHNYLYIFSRRASLRSALIFAVAPKTRVKRKAAAASLAAADIRKKQKVSLESVESLPTGSETTPSSINLPEIPAIGVTVAAPSSDVEGVSVVDTSAGSEGVTVAAPSSDVEGVSVVGTSAGSEGVTVAGPSSRVAEGTGSSVPGSGVEEGTTADSSPKTSQDILGKFAEDWLETLDKDETKSVSLFLCYQLVHVFSFTATKATEYAAAMVKKSDRTVRRWRSGLIDNDGGLPESQQGCYQRSGVLGQNKELHMRRKSRSSHWANSMNF